MAVPLEVSCGSGVCTNTGGVEFSLRRSPHRAKLTGMGTGVSVRKARPTDAESVARIYIDSWRDTYPLVLPAKVLNGMTLRGQTARWRTAISVATREMVLVAEDEKGRIIGMSSMGRAPDADTGYDGENYTLYIDPLMTGPGARRTLV